ncbi:class I SAM-dependent methyltransferase [Candidatus Pacearchaeota archaeon]|nr:class I SAM-dependent methyltransferase [Candidatus Pacearchaeota archaeon]
MTVLEIGCGEGHQAIFLSLNGLVVTAIDSSKEAINIAKENARKENASVSFICKDYAEIKDSRKKYDFVFDWRFLHEITKENERDNYLRDISKLLNSKGRYLSVSFSGDSNFMGEGNIRISPVGLPIYFEKMKDLEQRIEKSFIVIEKKHIFVPQKPNLKIKANYIFARKK